MGRIIVSSKRTCSKCAKERFVFEFPYGQDPNELVCFVCLKPVKKKKKEKEQEQPTEKQVEYVVSFNPDWLEDIDDWT